MKFTFKAKIYKVGINPCVKVPFRITKHMVATKGYIPVRGIIKDHSFEQTLCPVKNEAYRLYVNGLMLKGSGTKLGDTVSFTIEQNTAPQTAADLPMPLLLRKKLRDHGLRAAFKKLTPYRQKEILRYLNYLKTEEALSRNIEKVISGLKRS
ncbi:MAG: YdeI/OmpD-associated family protein [Chitinophagales bacterium]